MSDQFESHARTVTLLTLLSRITGLLRDAALSRMFGAGPLMSAFFFAFMIPNLFRRLFGEGALAAAFLPAYAKALKTDAQLARSLASLTIARLTVLLGLVTIVAELVLLALASTVARENPAVAFTMVMLPYMPMVCLVAILGAMLQVHGRFGPTAAAPIVLNLCFISATLGLPFVLRWHDDTDARLQTTHLLLVGFSLLLAGLIQLGWSLHTLRQQRWWTKDHAPARQPFRDMVRVMGPMIFSLGVLQLNTLMDGIIASYPVTFETSTLFGVDYPLDESAMAVLSFSQRLYQFPLGVFGIAVATAIFPLLSKQADDDEAFVNTLRRGLRLVIFIGLPASAGLMLVAEPLTSVIYRGGAFLPDDVARVGWVLLGYAPAIWAYSMTHTLTRAFYARGDSRRPMRIAVGMVLLNFALNCTFIWFLREAGLAWSTSLCAIIQVVLLNNQLRRHHVGRVIDRTVVASWGRSIGLTMVMCAIVVGTDILLRTLDEAWVAQLVRLAALTALGGGAVFLGAVVLRMPERHWALGIRGQSVRKR